MAAGTAFRALSHTCSSWCAPLLPARSLHPTLHPGIALGMSDPTQTREHATVAAAGHTLLVCLRAQVTKVTLDTNSLRANLDKASHVQQVVQVSVPHRIVASNVTKARGAASNRGARNRGLPPRSVADAPEWARECPPPEWDKKWLLCELDDSGRMRRVTQMWPPPQWHACSKAPCDRACAVHGHSMLQASDRRSHARALPRGGSHKWAFN